MPKELFNKLNEAFQRIPYEKAGYFNPCGLFHAFLSYKSQPRPADEAGRSCDVIPTGQEQDQAEHE